MVHFFEKQCHDGHEASHLAVKLQKILCGIIFLYVTWSIVGFIFFAYAVATPVFWFGFIGFGILFLGFYGSYQKRLGMLSAYFFCALGAVIFYAFVIIWYGVTAARLAGCASTNCLEYEGFDNAILKTAATLYIIEMIISFFIWILLICSLSVCRKLRNHLREAYHHHHHGGPVTYANASVPIYQQQPQQGYAPNVPPPSYTQTYQQPQGYQQQPQGYQQYQQPQGYQQPQVYQQPPVVPLDPNNPYNRA